MSRCCSRPRRRAVAGLQRAVAGAALIVASEVARAEPPPHELKLAFLGDQSLGDDAIAVLELVATEGADAVVHLGDFDYVDDPAGWDAQINGVLGADFPYFACIGNHDASAYYPVNGYQDHLESRMQRLGIPWSGDLGVASEFSWQGIHFVTTGPDVVGPGDGLHDVFIRDRFAASGAAWRISAWHKNQHLMQAGGKSDETGWGVYEASRRAGAIIATAHEHSYSRTHLLSSMEHQIVASTASPLVLRADAAATPADEGRSFAFVSGLGGQSIRDQEVFGAWFASVYTSTQGATFGALFGVFHVDGDPRLARFTFKDVAGNTVDEFLVRTVVGCGDLDDDGICDEADVCPAVSDPVQLDSDFDGYGNACDPDYDGDGLVGSSDFFLLSAAFMSSAGSPEYVPALDRDGDGAIDDLELEFVQEFFGAAPGPSGLVCAGAVPCSACDAPDSDGDGLCDAVDACVTARDPLQVDSDLDGYGNACDPDYDGDGVVGGQDFLALGQAFGASEGQIGYAPPLDANSDGTIGGPEIVVLGRHFAGGPGPSGRDCAGTFPCLGP